MLFFTRRSSQHEKFPAAVLRISRKISELAMQLRLVCVCATGSRCCWLPVRLPATFALAANSMAASGTSKRFDRSLTVAARKF